MVFLLHNLFFDPEIILRLMVSIFLGALIGLERTLAHKHAGIRTFALVSLGACTFIVLSQLMSTQAPTALDRVLANILLGISFLGGGVIFTQNNAVRGLTTAAALWASVGIGAAVGLGYYALAVWLSLLILTLLYFIGRWEANIKKDFEEDGA